MKRIALVALLLCVWMRGEAVGHDLQYTVDEGTAVSVRLFFAGGNEFSFEAYEVYRAGEEIPFQVGRTDARGRLAFFPDRPGTWRIKVFSEDGHGVDFSLTTGAQGIVEKADKPLFERSLRVVVGIAIIFGIFGFVSLFARGRGEK